jgi:retron-type reverse transcriptase
MIARCGKKLDAEQVCKRTQTAHELERRRLAAGQSVRAQSETKDIQGVPEKRSPKGPIVTEAYAPKSRNALKSVRQVTQENKGKLTPGVDRIVVKTVQERAELVDRLMSHQPWRASPVRRVYIPKASGKLRPLGVPTVLDRAMQAMVKNALEPYWEARFEPCSYGFRPGRGCHDAIGRVYNVATPIRRRKWVLDADIEGALDRASYCHPPYEG